VLEELSDHIMDIAMNSVRAGANNIFISVIGNPESNRLSIAIIDDGAGMDEETLKSVSDPFFSTKAGKNIGLGVSLLKGATEICDGEFHLASTPGVGTKIEAIFPLHHPDVPPLGNFKETMFLLCVANPDIRFSFCYSLNGKDFDLDTKEINNILEGLSINHPEVMSFLSRYMDERL
jgi:hypothetical protein